MGGRLSMPRGADGVNEISKPTSPRLTRGKGIINGRTIMAPLAALTMACLLFVYTRTSIRAAKMNAKKHREADGGQISWHKESMRRHGQIDKVDNDRVTIKEALMSDISRKKEQKAKVKDAGTKTERSTEEDELRKMMGKHD
ncbi:hypothetical protein K504DRAFT_112917 [Pleomassaria siparia CBS 279.74]|uniref:Uncharacterized protein n=1 Tax=Pleomassaria siparia CBS 279.74 TaxID=1314801 RepID=A0A6G1JX42_9PLEO|nr:hypothetical protein K504DRAFT_112917 [Pleomassaria siparia CBS 279.74]